MNDSRLCYRILLIVSLLLVTGGFRKASGLGITGILEGTVRDKQSREPLVGVSVFIVGTNQGGTTDAEGFYRIHNIRAGQYDVRFSYIGYATVTMKDVTILADLRTRIDVELESATIELEAVEVRAERPLIQKDQAATAFNIGEVKLDRLPVTRFQEVLALQPGTTLEGHVRGGRLHEVTFLVDGLPIQDVIGGGVGANLPKSSISGMTIYTGGFEAEYGNALSGVVNVITRTAGDKHTVSLRLDKDDWVSESLNKQQDRSTEMELSAGGPLKNGQLYYFTANTVYASDTRWWQDFQHYSLWPVSQEFSGFGKVEYVFSPETRLNLQGIYSLRKWHDYEFSWRFNLDGLPVRSRNSYRVALVLSETVSKNAYYTLSLSRFYHRSRVGEGSPGQLSLQPYQYDFFLRYIVDGQRNWWANTRQLIYSLKGDLSLHLAKIHLLKGGVEFNLYDIASDLVKYEPQTTYFGKPIVDAPLLDYSNKYKYYPKSGSVFIQDKIELVRDGSNVSFGLRWEFLDPTAQRPIVEFVPTRPNQYEQQVVGWTRARFKHQFSPRIAVAAPVGLASFFFMNFGDYFQFPLFDYLYSGINPVQLREGVKNVLTGNPDLEPERTRAWEVGFKYGLSSNVVASITHFRKTTKNQVDSKTLIPFDSKAAGDYGFATYVNHAEANSSGLEIVISRERDENLSGSISYAYMTTEGISEYVDQSINLAQWGFPLAVKPYPLSWDQRHTVKCDAEFRLPAAIRANLIVLYNSARPYTYYPTRDGFSPLDSTKAFVPNNRRMEDVAFINVKLTRRFELGEVNKYLVTLYADIRNLINKKNVRWIDSSGRIGGELGDPGAYYDPRRVRVGVRVEYSER